MDATTVGLLPGADGDPDIAVYPNPFNPIVNIKIKTEAAAFAAIYDLRGRLVRMLVNKPQESGYYTALWDGRTEKGGFAGSGVYFYRINVNNRFNKTMRMVMVK